MQKSELRSYVWTWWIRSPRESTPDVLYRTNCTTHSSSFKSSWSKCWLRLLDCSTKVASLSERLHFLKHSKTLFKLRKIYRFTSNTRIACTPEKAESQKTIVFFVSTRSLDSILWYKPFDSGVLKTHQTPQHPPPQSPLIIFYVHTHTVDFLYSSSNIYALWRWLRLLCNNCSPILNNFKPSHFTQNWVIWEMYFITAIRQHILSKGL